MGDNSVEQQQSQARLTPDKSGYIAANGLQIYYEVFGAGHPLILLHGGTATGRSWYGHIPTFAKGFRTITVDSRGHGKTDNPAGELRYTTMADDVAAFIREMLLESPLVLGFSDGAQIAIELGLRHPGLARALVLGGAYHRFSEQYQTGLRGYGFEGPDESGKARIREIPEEWAAYLQQEHEGQGDPDYWKSLMNQIAVMWWTPLNYTAQDFASITVPTLVVSGDREEASEVEQSVELYRMIPKAELFIVPNAGHMVSADQMSNPLVYEFLIRNSRDR